MKIYYLAAIDGGNVKAMNNLAHYYRYTEVDIPFMKQYYWMAIKSGDADSMCELAEFYRETQEYDLMKFYYEHAVKLNHVPAINQLADYYRWVEKDYRLMENLYLRGIKLNSATSYNNLAHYYCHEVMCLSQAIEYYERAIELGNVTALNNLAILYEEIGQYDKMKTNFQAAIEQGHTDAMINLAHYYFHHDQPDLTIYYFEKAAALGDDRAQNNLGYYYETRRLDESEDKAMTRRLDESEGKAMTRRLDESEGKDQTDVVVPEEEFNPRDRKKQDDLALAETYYRQAIEKNNVAALNNLARLCRQRGDYDAMKQYYVRAIELLDHQSMSDLATYYGEVEHDFPRMKDYYLRAIQYGNQSAIIKLGHYYHDQVDMEGLYFALQHRQYALARHLTSQILPRLHSDQNPAFADCLRQIPDGFLNSDCLALKRKQMKSPSRSWYQCLFSPCITDQASYLVIN